MKSFKYLPVLLILCFSAVFPATAQNFQPIVLDTTLHTASCSGFTVSVPAEVLTGDNIPLNITLPGTLAPDCDVSINIQYQSPNNKISFVASSSVPFTDNGGTLTTTAPLAGNDGQNFNVFFRFGNKVTCNGEQGTLDVTFTTCQGSCTVQVQTTARAGNYWDVKKTFEIGNLTCGISKWRIVTWEYNPNPSGYGSYQIQNGTIQETTSLPVLSNPTQTLYHVYGANFFMVYLQNCQNTGTVITNTAHYDFTMGDGCEVMQGDVQAVSDTLVSPNADINFIKVLYSTSGTYNSGMYNLAAGCEGFYRIQVYNNGNTIWQINQITDQFPAEIEITWINPGGFSLPGGFPTYPLSGPGTLTFNAPSGGILLNPGEYRNIYVYFRVKNAVSTGSIVTNSAILNYQGSNGTGGNSGGGNGTNGCPGVNCPTINTAVQTDTAAVKFRVTEAFPVEKIKKCIMDPSPGKIYSIGDTIHFRYVLGNFGSGDLNTVLSDNMSLPGQNLQILPASVNYIYHPDQNTNNGFYNCNFNFSQSQPLAGTGITVTPNFSNLQNPIFQINNLPGICQLYRYNALEIEFDAIIMTQNYGDKTNTVSIDQYHNSSVNYTVDQVGILEVDKYADTEFVDDGGSFNYIIEVTNSGSVPLDHIQVSDTLPPCVNLQQGITVKDPAGNSVAYTLSGNVNINIDPAAVLDPAGSFTITIPVTKAGGGNCCNRSVTAHGTMTTSGVVLEANNGTETNPAACVKSSQCCDIPDFEAGLTTNADGSYTVHITGGAVPLQEVDIAMMDYHVTYSQPDCRPDDLGIFGTLSTAQGMLGGLVLDSTSNHTGVLHWQAGQPSVMNSDVQLEVSKPDTLSLDCCDMQFYFCLKVTVKDVNCNVCEKIVCVEPENPCQLSVHEIPRQLCNSEDLQIQWTGNNTGGNVDVYLYPAGGNTGNAIQIASGQPQSGSLTWTVPQNIQPCDQYWTVVVADAENPKTCHAQSNRILIKCCTQCECGKWSGHQIGITSRAIQPRDYDSRTRKKYGDQQPLPTSPIQYINCGGDYHIHSPAQLSFTAPVYQCNPSEACQATYEWEMTGPGNLSLNGQGASFTYSIASPGVYEISFTPVCGNNTCETCKIRVIYCNDECRMFENFEDGQLGHWQAHNASNLMVINNSGPNQFGLFVTDASGASHIYNEQDFPSNLIAMGCELQYDVQFGAGANNATTATNSISIYRGTFNNRTFTATFVLNSAHSLVSGSGWQSIHVPLKLATGYHLPSNAYGEWRVNGTNTPGAANIVLFNQLIQQVDGVYFFLDTGSNPVEIWKYDNFCFKRCCQTGIDTQQDHQEKE